MAFIELSTPVTHKTLLEAIQHCKTVGFARETYGIHVPEKCFISCSGLALLGAWGQTLIKGGNKIKVHADEETLGYLSRMDLLRLLGVEYKETFVRRVEAGRFIPLHKVESTRDCGRIIAGVGDLILHQFDNARDFFPAMEWAVNEVVDNITIHSETAVPGVVCAQYFPDTKRIDVGICDMGRGIKASLSERYELISHEAAITKALMRGVTRNPDVGQGNGLAGTFEITRANGGTFQLWSGDACFKMSKGAKETFEMIPELPGTGVFLSLDTTKAVDLRTDTFIGAFPFGDNESTYIYMESERAAVGDGLVVKDECHHTGSRPPAKALRRKVLTLLPNVDKGPIILNFANVTSTTSSFLDELLARLVVELGPATFAQKIKVVNATETITRMANVVINQRLESIKNNKITNP